MSISVWLDDDNKDDLRVILVDHINSEKVVIPLGEVDNVIEKIRKTQQEVATND